MKNYYLGSKRDKQGMLNWQRISWRYFGVVAIVIALCLVTLVISRTITRPPQLVGELLAHIPSRPVAARLSTLPQYAPYQPQLPVALSKQLPKTQRVQFNQLMANLLSVTTSTPEVVLSLATVYLVENKLTEAIQQLETEVAKHPQNVLLLNDLAVAYLQRAQQDNKPYYFIKALSNIDLAIANNAQLTCAYFNRALILENLYLLPAAQTAWQQYIELETVPEWQQEAQTHRKQLATALAATDVVAQQAQLKTAALRGDTQMVAKLVIDYPQMARAYTLEQLLPAWANSVEDVLAKEATTAANLHLAREVGQLLAVQQGDKLLRDVVATIDQAYQDAANPSRLSQLARAHRAYSQANKLLTQDDSDQAETFAQQAIALFRDAQDAAGEVIITLLQAKIWVSRYEYRPAIAALDRVQQIARERSYLNALGRAYWISGNIHRWRYEIDQVLTTREAAANYLKITGDLEGVAMTHFLLGDTLAQLGKVDEIWDHQYQALQWLSRIGQTRFRANILSGIADESRRLGELSAALHFQNASLIAAQEVNNYLMASYGFLQRSFIYQQLNRREAAQADLAAARRYLQEVPTGPFHERVLHVLRVAEGDYLLATNPTQAITIFSDLINLFINTDDRESLAHLYLSRARGYLLINKDLEAEADLNASIQEWEARRRNISSERQRISFFEETLATYEEMLTLLVTRRAKPEAAFYYAEASRGRVLLDLLMRGDYPIKRDQQGNLIIAGVAHPLGITDIQRRLPPKTALIEYAWLSDKLLIWVIKPNSTHFAVSVVARYELEKLVRVFNQTVKTATPSTPLTAFSGKLYQLLLQPIIAHLADVTTLAIVPDKELHQIPFAALVNPDNNHFLVEDFILERAPSATIFLHCLERDAQLTKLIKTQNIDNRRILLVGNPTFDRQLFPGLPAYLPAAEDEAKKIAALYPRHQLLVGEQATKKTFFTALENSNIVHFAGHAIADQDSPLNSKLLLTPALATNAPGDSKNRDNGVMYAYELYNQGFAGTQLAVLSACRTAGGTYISGEGVTNLARPLLAAGVPAIVASLENVPDETTAQFFVQFHRRLIATGDPATALRQTQLAAIKAEYTQLRNPSKWAMFVMLGGVNIR
jgi:CHAT domain-containing protein